MNRAVLLAALLAAYVALSMLMALQGSGVEVSEGYFESGGARLRYLAWRPRGRVAGTALLYHGFGGSSEMMGWIGVELARAGYLAVAYDARGHGKSSSTLSYDPSLLVEDFRALARLFNFTGELALVGHSMGGRAVQDLASRLNASRVVVVAAPPAGSPSAPSLLVLAGFDEIFKLGDVAKANLSGWSVYVSPWDDHLTILYSPSAIARILAWVKPGAETAAAPRLALALARSLTAAALLALAPSVLARGGAKGLEGASFRKLAPAAALAAPLSLPLYLALSSILRAPVAAYVVALFYSQAAGVTALSARRLSRVRELAKSVGARTPAWGAVAALAAYFLAHEMLQPFFNVEPSLYRLPVAAALALLFLPAAALTEALAFQSGGSAAESFAKRFAARSVGFLAAWLVFSVFVGGGYAGYLLVVTYVSLLLLAPLELFAASLAARGAGSVNVVWQPLVLGALLGAVTPLA